MKYLAAVVLWLSVVGWVKAGELSGREMAKWQIAVRSGARQFEENLVALAQLTEDDQTRLVDALAAAIVSDPQAHQSRKSSLAASEKLIASWVARRYEVLLAEVCTEAATHAGRAVQAADIAPRLPEGLRESDQFMKKVSEKKAAEAFKLARERVVAMGRFSVDKHLSYPAEEVLNLQLAELASKKKSRLELKDFETLTDWIAGIVMPEFSVQLEEVADYARGAAVRVLVDIMGQYDRQADALKQARGDVPKDLIKSSDIEGHLVDAVTLAVDSSLRPVLGGVRYGVFGIIKEEARDAAGSLEARRFGAFVRNSAALSVPADQVQTFLQNNLAVCRDPKMARNSLVEMFFPLLQDRALEFYGGGNTSDVEYLRQRFDTTVTWQKALTNRIETDLDQILPVVRREIAHDQLKSIFPGLIKDRFFGESTLLEAEARKLDPRQVDGMLAILELDGLKVPSEDERERLLQECLELAKAWTAERLELGRKVFAAQREMVDEVEARRKADLEKDVAEGRKVEKILETWTDDVRRAWTMAPAEWVGVYPELFGQTLAMISKNVRQLYDAKRQAHDKETVIPQAVAAVLAKDNDREPATKKEEEAPVTQPKEPEKPPVEQENEAEAEPEAKEMTEKEKQSRDFLELAYSIDADPPDLQITMNRTEGGKCVMELTLPGTEQVLARVEFDPATIDNSSEKLAEVLAGPLGQVIAKEKASKRGIWPFKIRGKTPEVTLYMTIKSPDIRHVMNLRLREALQEKLGDDVMLRWRVGL